MASRKLIVLGEAGVGKTSLIRRFVHGRFEQDYLKSLGVDISTYLVPIPPQYQAGVGGASELRLMIWDTDGDFGMRIFRETFFKGTSAALIVSDLSRPETRVAMRDLAEGFEDASPGRPYALVLNKSDLVASTADLDAAAADVRGPRVVTTSALNGSGVPEAFGHVALSLIKRGL